MDIKRFTISLIIAIYSLSSCTTAVLDEGSVDELPDLTEPVRYNPEVKNIMTNNCITCHGGPTPEANLDLTTYNNVKNAAMGNLMGRINNQLNPMPPTGLMPPIERQKMQKWVDDNYPEN